MRNFAERFFNDRDTWEQITALAKVERLVVYAGAGVTIDRTRTSWAALLRGLLLHEPLDISPEEASFVLSTHTPQAAASLAYEAFRRIYPDPEKIMQAEMRRLLYPYEVIPGYARLSSSIAAVLQLWVDSGRSAALVTPNYEDVLLEELRQVSETDTNIFYVGESDLNSLWETQGVKYVYLHGALPELAGVPEQASPVLTERDYDAREHAIRNALELAFTDSAVLLIGTSLQDSPLISALLRSREKAPDALRFAVLPTQGAAWRLFDNQSQSAPSAVKVAEFKLRRAHLSALRLEHLGVCGIYPDYYSQVPQLLDEVRECVTVELPYEDADFASRYGHRLRDWWGAWVKDLGSLQLEHHDELRRQLEILRTMLAADRKEQLKIELWLRWEPGRKRCLRLWASSQGTISEPDASREEPIRGDSDFVAVNVFCEGKTLMPTAVPAGRWPTYVGVPLYFVSGSATAVSLPVGSVVVASMRKGRTSSVHEANGARLNEALANLQEAVRQLIVPPSLEDPSLTISS